MDKRVAEKIQAFDQEPWIPDAWRRALRRYGLVALVLTVMVGLGLWLRYVAAPSPEEICQHKIALTRAEAQTQAPAAGAKLIAKLQATCVASAERRIRLEGKIAYARFARCVAAAQNLGQAERC